jgi:hypothetical protein
MIKLYQNVYKFVCQRCKYPVTRFDAIEPEKEMCYECQFITDNPDLPQEIIDVLDGKEVTKDSEVQ